MAGKEQVMTVLMGPVEVRQTFRDWPADMCLAVCLMESGDCQLVVFRHEELAEFPARLRRHLGLTASELCFFPRVEGYPARALLYSDEQRLMALVAEAPEIVEEATDYSVNYAYALDEGLDPVVFLGIEAANRAPEPEPEVLPEAREETALADEEEQAASFVSSRSKPLASPSPQGAGRVRKALLPGFMQRQEAVRPGPHFRSARELGFSEEARVPCDVLPEKSGWILIARHDEGGADIRVSDPDQIYLRDDRRVVAIRLELPWQASAALPARIWLRADSLPKSLRGVFADCVGAAELSGTGAFLYLHILARPALDRVEMPVALDVSPTFKVTGEAGADEAPEVQVEAEAGAEAEAPESEEARGDDVPQELKTRAAVLPAWRGGLWRGRRRWLAATVAASLLALLQIGMQFGGRGDISAAGSDQPVNWEVFRSASQVDAAG